MNSSLLLAALLAANPLSAPATQPASASVEASVPSRFSMTVEGRGPDVILIPGLMSGRRVWDDAAAALGGYRVHRLQVAGFAGGPVGANADGEILAPLVEALQAYVAGEGLERPAIVGHSMGGLVGLMLAQRHPDSVGRLMIVDALPFYSLLFSPQATVEAVTPQAAAMRDALLAMDAGAFAGQQSATMARLVGNEAARPALLADAMASDRSVAARAMFELMTTDVRPELPAVSAPVTIVYATNAFTARAMAEPLYRSAYAGLPDAELVEMPDSHHFVMTDQPERFAEVLKAFLAAE